MPHLTAPWPAHHCRLAPPQVCAPIEELVTQIEGCWRSVLPEDQFGLYPLDEASGAEARLKWVCGRERCWQRSKEEHGGSRGGMCSVGRTG